MFANALGTGHCVAGLLILMNASPAFRFNGTSSYNFCRDLHEAYAAKIRSVGYLEMGRATYSFQQWQSQSHMVPTSHPHGARSA